MKNANARRIAYDIFKEIMSDNKYSNLAIKQRLTNETKKQDRAFITKLVYGTLEHLITIDYIISLYAKKSIKPAIKDILRLGVYQIYYLNVPDSAACNESVRLAKELGKDGAASFINAVLRNISRDKENLAFPDKKDLVKYLSVIYSYPEHIVKLLINDYGQDTAEKIMAFEANNDFTVRPNVTKINCEDLTKKFIDNGFIVKNSSLIKEALIVNDSDIISSELYKKGFLSIQSESSMLAAQTVVNAVSKIKAPTILDACAAPGGKTFYIKEHVKDSKLTSWDIHEHRVKLIDASASRLGLLEIKTEAQDATILKEEYIEYFDAVLIDAPCSGLGVIYSKPDIKYSSSEADLKEIKKLQRKILDTCSKYVKNSGALIYSTCTILKDENENMVNEFLEKNRSFKKKQINDLINIDNKHIANGYAQMLNINTGHEGFFIAGMVKNT